MGSQAGFEDRPNRPAERCGRRNGCGQGHVPVPKRSGEPLACLGTARVVLMVFPIINTETVYCEEHAALP